MSELACTQCGKRYPASEARWRCRCGGLLDLVWRSTFDPERIAGRAATIWRYREALPIEDDAHIVSLGEGVTPMLHVRVDGAPVWLKQDHLFPTGSYKDRGAAVLMSKAVELGVRQVVEDSSGNAGAAIAAYSARAGIACSIYVPEHTSAAKLVQIERCGAALHRIPGSREDTARAALAAAEDVYYASHSWNPFFFHGTKTFAFEVCEQLGWRAPDAVVLPVGNGTLLLGAAIGFRELRAAGVIERLPALIGVQAEACAPLSNAWRQGIDAPAPIASSATLAEGIAIADPVRGAQILRAVRESGGAFLEVSEEEIRAALADLCRRGFYVEPTAAVAVAGTRAFLRQHGDCETVVSTLTGHGLKATDKLAALW
ncbi:MAG: threonine synthase [Anaerolineae bacterium]|nr:threonine synthase [Anaerolineae bacterium]